jgi:hypothetical protein
MPRCPHGDYFCLTEDGNCHSLALDGTVLLDRISDFLRLHAIQTSSSATEILDHILSFNRHSRDRICRRFTELSRVACRMVFGNRIDRGTMLCLCARRRGGQEAFALEPPISRVIGN